MRSAFPNESRAYRVAREALLQREIELRRQMESVAAELRSLLSAADCSFRRDYGGDGADGQPCPLMTVFKRWPDGTMRLHWASELVFAPTDPGQHPRHLGTVEPLWTLFDLTPGGRPTADEQIEYDCCGLASFDRMN